MKCDHTFLVLSLLISIFYFDTIYCGNQHNANRDRPPDLPNQFFWFIQTVYLTYLTSDQVNVIQPVFYLSLLYKSKFTLFMNLIHKKSKLFLFGFCLIYMMYENPPNPYDLWTVLMHMQSNIYQTSQCKNFPNPSYSRIEIYHIWYVPIFPKLSVHSPHPATHIVLWYINSPNYNTPNI